MSDTCQRLCIDDICRGGESLCGGTFCLGCQTAICFDSGSLCDFCIERFRDPEEDDPLDDWIDE